MTVAILYDNMTASQTGSSVFLKILHLLFKDINSTEDPNALFVLFTVTVKSFGGSQKNDETKW